MIKVVLKRVRGAKVKEIITGLFDGTPSKTQYEVTYSNSGTMRSWIIIKLSYEDKSKIRGEVPITVELIKEENDG